MLSPVPGHAPILISIEVLAGVGLLVALRGRRVDDHPLCRKCRFDLFNRPPGSKRCPECGASLNRRRAIRIGHRERRGRLLLLCLPVFLACFAWLGVIGYAKASAVEWIRHKPVWWLLKDVDSSVAVQRDPALRELARRINEHALPAEVEKKLVERALEVQTDPLKPWSVEWGRIIESAWAVNRLSQPQWDQFINRTVSLRLEPADPEVPGGHPLVLRMIRGPDRGGPTPTEVELEVDPHIDLDGSQDHYVYFDGIYSNTTLHAPPQQNDVPIGGVLGKAVVELDADGAAPPSLGEHIVRVTVKTRRVRQTSTVIGGIASFFLPNLPQREVALSATWTRLPPDPTRPPPPKRQEEPEYSY